MNETEQILTSILDCNRTDLYLKGPVLNHEQQKRFDHIIAQRKNGQPLQYLLGNCNFMGYELKVNPHVLIPRPETEMLVELALGHIQFINKDFIRILDLGTGSGNIAISLAKNLKNAYITAVDISAQALDVACHNAASNHVEGQIHFICESMINFLELPKEFVNKFDIIISNPPYIKTDALKNLPEDVLKEPTIALEAGKDGLYFIRKIIQNAYKFLNQGGYLFFEMGQDQGRDVLEIFNRYPQYKDVAVIKDLNQRDRFTCAQLRNT